MQPVTGSKVGMGLTPIPTINTLDVVTGRIMAGSLGYYVRVEGSGPPVLLLHGFTGSHQSFDGICQRLSQRFTVVRPDLPGHGASVVGKTQAWTMDTVVFSLFRLMRELGFPTFSCLGYSMGARVALAMAAQAPNRLDCLVAESGSPGLRTAEEREARVQADNALAVRMESMGLLAFVDEWNQKPLFQTQQGLSKAAKERQRNIRLSHLVTGLAASLRNMGTGAQPSVWEGLPQVQVPTLLVTGEADEKFHRIAAEMITLLPDAQHVVIPGAGHDVHLEQPDRYYDATLAFLERHAKLPPEWHSWTLGTMFGVDEEQ